MSVNDRLFDELLKPVVEDYYRVCQALSVIEATADTAVSRAMLHGQLTAFAATGNRIAAVLEVAEPLWADMFEATRQVPA